MRRRKWYSRASLVEGSVRCELGSLDSKKKREESEQESELSRSRSKERRSGVPSPSIDLELKEYFHERGALSVGEAELLLGMSSEEEELSDWEKEIDGETGQVLFIGGISSPVKAPGAQAWPCLSLDPKEKKEEKKQRRSKGLKLSRLVRRRDSDEEDEESLGGIQTFESLLQVPSESIVESVFLDLQILVTIAEGDNIIVNGFKRPITEEEKIKIGDWIRLGRSITRNKKVERIVAWQRVHNPAYGKTSLLVVGLGHQILAALMESLDGGSRKIFSPPDPFYVDHADNTLDHLHEMGIPLVFVTNGFHSTKSRHNKILINFMIIIRTIQKHLVLKDIPLIPQKHLTKKDMFDEYYYDEEQSTAFRGLEEGSSMSSITETSKRTLNNSNDEHEELEEEMITYRISQLSISKENTVFHFIHLDFGEGIFLSPLSTPSGNLHKELLINIRASAQIIHSTFQMALRNGEMLKNLRKSKDYSFTPA
ncbi:INTU [Lepeophtheirus salmonis]|uniref:INTU n=1 Tax=Lepeophtheirus salmonis TaxID=72036 RepID=A0A7R8CDF3_LEPSM|nr:INTU [Lepeophtheirus salmonis]CAF2780562.1 INTU [Lepeophtheirus salmonis]